jgi:hypothetical protein
LATFITRRADYLDKGGISQPQQLCQLEKSGRAPLDKVIIKVAQLKEIAKYYKGAGTIKQHNRIHTNELQMDHNLATTHWDRRFNLSVLGMIGIDALLFPNRLSMQRAGQRAALRSSEV